MNDDPQCSGVKSEAELLREQNRRRDVSLASLFKDSEYPSDNENLDPQCSPVKSELQILREQNIRQQHTSVTSLLNDSVEFMSDDDNSGPQCSGEKSELELLREQNIKRRDAYLASLMNDPEYVEVMGFATSLGKNWSPEKKSKTKKNNRGTATATDPTFRSSAYVFSPPQRRRSARLENKSPIFTKDDLLDESTFKRKKRTDDKDDYGYIDDIENVVSQPRKSNIRRTVQYSPLISVEDVTDQMINNIAKKVSAKKYSDSGTTCHQCRQKTLDQKTCCRSNSCVGIRGQFCGICLENRYGETVAVALKDPNWQCPVCRGICNCSFCRAKAGKKPTGILAPQVQQAGHKSVKDFLDSLRGEDDRLLPMNSNDLLQKANDPKYLLGFSKDLTVACMGGGVHYKMDCPLTMEKMQFYINQQKQRLSKLIEQHQDNAEQDLLGFVEGTGEARMNNNVQHEMGDSLSLERIEAFIREKQREIDRARR